MAALERALRREDLLGGASVQALFDKAMVAFVYHGQHTADSNRKRGEWTADPECYQAAMLAAIEALILNQPDPPKGTNLGEAVYLQIEALKGRLATYFWNKGKE